MGNSKNNGSTPRRVFTDPCLTFSIHVLKRRYCSTLQLSPGREAQNFLKPLESTSSVLARLEIFSFSFRVLHFFLAFCSWQKNSHKTSFQNRCSRPLDLLTLKARCFSAILGPFKEALLTCEVTPLNDFTPLLKRKSKKETKKNQERETKKTKRNLSLPQRNRENHQCTETASRILLYLYFLLPMRSWLLLVVKWKR